MKRDDLILVTISSTASEREKQYISSRSTHIRKRKLTRILMNAAVFQAGKPPRVLSKTQ